MTEPQIKQPADFQQRQQALDPTQSFICEAPAGSGKTELLTQRFLTLLARVERPEQVLAITFTRKAVGEMRERILGALQSALQDKPSEPHKQTTWGLASAVLRQDQLLHWHLLENPNRLQIKTFDSLCSSLTNAMPLESAVGSKPQVAEDAEELYRRSVRALLASLENDEPWGDALAVLLQQMDNRFSRLEELLMQMLARREEWLPLLGYALDKEQVRQALENNLLSIIRDNVEKTTGLIPFELHKDIVAMASFAAANLRRIEQDSPIQNCLDMDLDNQSLPGWGEQDLPRWLGIVNMLTTLKDQWRATVNKRCGFPAGETAAEKKDFKQRKQQMLQLIGQLKEVDGLQQALADIRLLPASHYSHEQWSLLDALTQVLPIVAAQLMLVFQETNSVDFAEISIRARQALGALDDPTQLALKMDYRLQHILVDEFQDTSSSQVELLEQLTAGWQADDGRTLFCVGDAMQSIYGFRGANVGLFLNCRQEGLQNVPLTPLRLNTNFRSQAGVVDWVNRVFDSAFPSNNDISTGAVTYSPSQAFHATREGRAVWVHGFVDRKNNHDNYDEAQVILDVVRKTRSEQPDASVAILVRNRTHAAHILPLLKEAGVPYRAVDLERLQDQSVIQDLMALTQALMHPADRISWLAVLRAPWCGLSLVDLEAIANFQAGDFGPYPPLLKQIQQILELSVPQSTATKLAPQQNDFFLTQGQILSSDGMDRLKRILPILQQACDNLDRKPLRSWVEGTWLALGGAACVEEAEALKNSEKYFELLETWAYAGSLPSFEALQKAVSKLYAAPDPNADERLQIMTIHKSKGLEFDVVIVPALHRAPRSEDTALLMWQDRLNAHGEMELVMAPLTAVGKDKHPTYQHLQAEAAKKSRYEACRLLYVACTRAKQELHLSAHVSQDATDSLSLKPPPKSALLSSIWEPIQTHIRRYEPKQAIESTEGGYTPRPIYRLPCSWQFPSLPSGHLLDQYVPRYEYNDASNQVDLQWQNPTARAVGILVHRYLQHIGESGIQQWGADAIHQLQPQMKQALLGLGVPMNQASSAADKVRLALQMVLQDEKASLFLSSKHPFHACEYPVTFNTSVGPKNLQIDRVYTTSQGTTWVVDYKTSSPEPGQDLEAFIALQIEQYQAQLSLYQRALHSAGFAKVKMALYFPLIAHWQEVG